MAARHAEAMRADFPLSADQQKALDEIEAAEEPGAFHVLMGPAGSGKTEVLKRYAQRALQRRKRVGPTAATHKAAAVVSRSLARAGIDLDCRTIDSKLGLRARPNADRLEFVRPKDAEPVEDDIVPIDECSMLGMDRLVHVRRHLPLSFVLYVGDEYQIPPVGELRSQAFDVRRKSVLTKIQRQAEGNPILQVSQAVRELQGTGRMHYDWCKPNNDGKQGIFVPRDASAWLKKAFTSGEFDAEPDSFRYVAYTNARVAQINRMVRFWRCGDRIPTPFMPGERAMFRDPLLVGDAIIFATSEEGTVLEIARDTFFHRVGETKRCPEWSAKLPAWRIVMVKHDLTEHVVYAPADEQAHRQVIARITDEAKAENDKKRWRQLHQFKSAMANIVPPYALTAHNSQGSTFRFTFVDVPSIARRCRDNLLEAQQIFYTALTRPSTGLILPYGVGE